MLISPVFTLSKTSSGAFSLIVLTLSMVSCDTPASLANSFFVSTCLISGILSSNFVTIQLSPNQLDNIDFDVIGTSDY